jgi:hypothetical protein
VQRLRGFGFRVEVLGLAPVPGPGVRSGVRGSERGSWFGVRSGVRGSWFVVRGSGFGVRGSGFGLHQFANGVVGSVKEDVEPERLVVEKVVGLPTPHLA